VVFVTHHIDEAVYLADRVVVLTALAKASEEQELVGNARHAHQMKEHAMASSLIRGKYVVAKVASRTEVEVIPDGAVFQRDGIIVEIGPHADLAARHRPDEVLGSPDHVVVPGFVNGHHHVGLTPFQLGSPDYALELWFASRMAARGVDPYLDTLYSAFEMVESGITTVQHLHGWRIGPAAKVIEVADRVLKAYDDIGMRVSYSYALRDQNRLAYEADEAFAARFPAPVSGELLAYLRAQAIPIDDHHGIFTDLWVKCGRNTPAGARATGAGEPPLVLR
jgi:5-methylthioadenosine/S-adenosylhomocysteine deaminase